jgi:hypothetical protein
MGDHSFVVRMAAFGFWFVFILGPYGSPWFSVCVHFLARMAAPGFWIVGFFPS